MQPAVMAAVLAGTISLLLIATKTNAGTYSYTIVMTTTDSVVTIVDKHVEFLPAEILEQPQSVVAFPGESTTFRCRGTGNIFWRVNNTLFDFTNSDFFTEHGIRSEMSYDGNPQLTVGSLTVQTSFPTNNNTVFRCTVMDTEREVMNTSQSASLFIVGEYNTLNMQA